MGPSLLARGGIAGEQFRDRYSGEHAVLRFEIRHDRAYVLALNTHALDLVRLAAARFTESFHLDSRQLADDDSRTRRHIFWSAIGILAGSNHGEFAAVGSGQ